MCAMPSRNPPATMADYQRVIDMEAQGLPVMEAAKLLDIPHQTYRSRLQKAHQLGLTPGPVEEMSEMAQEVQDLKDQIRALNGELRTTRRENITSQAVRKVILGLADQSPSPPTWTLRPDKMGDAGIPILKISDLHWGEVVDPAAVNGVNEYNTAIAHKRMRRLIEKTLSLCFNHMVGTNYPGIVVNLEGDLISGDIHNELRETNDLTTMQSFLDLYEVLIWALGTLADHFERVFVTCVPGNHGRLTVRPVFKGRNYSNWDWLMGCFLEKHFKADKRVNFHVPDGTDAHFSVAGHRIMSTHGDCLGTAGGDGIIGFIGPLVRGRLKTSKQADSLNMAYDTLSVGHYHTHLPLVPKVLANGSMIGFNEFAKDKLRAEAEPPSQTLYFVHPDIGITVTWQVLLEARAKRKATAWVSWPEAA